MKKPKALPADIIHRPCSLWPCVVLASKGNHPWSLPIVHGYGICQLMFSNKGCLFFLIIWTFSIYVHLHIQTRTTLFWVNSPISLQPRWGGKEDLHPKHQTENNGNRQPSKSFGMICRRKPALINAIKMLVFHVIVIPGPCYNYWCWWQPSSDSLQFAAGEGGGRDFIRTFAHLPQFNLKPIILQTKYINPP